MVDGGTAHGYEINDQLLCLQGVPPSPYIKHWRGGGPALSMARPRRSPTPTGSRIPPLPSSRSRSQGKGREKRRKEGAQPLPLVQFGLGLWGAPSRSSLFPLKPNKAHILPGEFP